MSDEQNFCSNCGEKLVTNVDNEECPKCHSALREHSRDKQSSQSVVATLPYKSPGTAALIAFIGGIFALPGIGHIYVGKVGRGIGILILGLILYALSVATISSVGFLASLEQPNSASEYASAGIGAIAMMLVFNIAYIVLFIWQIFNARKLAKKFNELVKSTGKEPW